MKKVILITGSTDGIGKLAAIKLAESQHEIYVHGRDPDKLTNVVNEIRGTTGNDLVDGFTADFSDLKEVDRMAELIRHKLPRIDVLINNAGIYKSPQSTTKDGLDIRFTVNYFAPYILTQALLPPLKKSEAPRIINLSSAAQTSVSLKALSGQRKISTSEAYAQSKLAILLWTFGMAKIYPDISMIALNPGSLLNTNMVREAFGKSWASADKGADIIYDLAVLKRYQNITGKYFDNDRGSIGQAHPDAYDAGIIDELLKKTSFILERILPESNISYPG